jgi:hypothetical protein
LLGSLSKGLGPPHSSKVRINPKSNYVPEQGEKNPLQEVRLCFQIFWCGLKVELAIRTFLG